MAAVAAFERNIGDATARPQEKPCNMRGAQAPHVAADGDAEVTAEFAGDVDDLAGSHQLAEKLATRTG